MVLGVAIASGVFWFVSGNYARGIKAFISVLIVACPCALALAAPFALGTAHRLLAKMQVFLKNAFVLERMAQVNSIVFDKTGTLTARTNGVTFSGSRGSELSSEEVTSVASLTRHSIHPHAIRIGATLGERHAVAAVTSFEEVPGFGMEGEVSGRHLLLGSRQWLEKHGVVISNNESPAGSVSYLSMDDKCRGFFSLSNDIRSNISELPGQLRNNYAVALLSGDNDNERCRFQNLLGDNARLFFDQSPFDKLCFIRNLQKTGKTVMMVGDGLNDAGALKQSDVGVAVVENVSAFSPASDVILQAGRVSRLSAIMDFARTSVRIVRFSFGLSAAYNLAGISIAAAGLLSPLVCAVLMPLSSISVVLFACGTIRWAAARRGLGIPKSESRNPNLTNS
jgi:Cu+-exporting ATPase